MIFMPFLFPVQSYSTVSNPSAFIFAKFLNARQASVHVLIIVYTHKGFV